VAEPWAAADSLCFPAVLAAHADGAEDLVVDHREGASAALEAEALEAVAPEGTGNFFFADNQCVALLFAPIQNLFRGLRFKWYHRFIGYRSPQGACGNPSFVEGFSV